MDSSDDKLISIRQDILNIASEVTDESVEGAVSLILLKLRDVIRSNKLTSKTIRHAYFLIWKCDLLHVMIEELRGDFTGEGWNVGVSLARLLSSTCCGLHLNASEATPQTMSLTSYTVDEMDEYYNMLLPAATDSLLVLANNIYECEEKSRDHPGHTPLFHLDQFEAVTDCLIRLCSAHITCVGRVVQSSYLIHLLITDDRNYSLSVLTSLYELVKLDEQVISRQHQEVIQSLLDELVYKLGGNDKETSLMSLRIIALFSTSSSAIFDLICTRYSGISSLLRRYSKTSMDPDMISFVSTLLERVKLSDEEEQMDKAAVIIQAVWRGYAERRKLKRINKGISLFQRLFRKRRAQKQSHVTCSRHEKDDEIMKITLAREKLQQEIMLIEQQLPPPVNGKEQEEKCNVMPHLENVNHTSLQAMESFNPSVISNEHHHPIGKRIDILTTELSHQTQQLLSMPSLADSTSSTSAQFTCDSTSDVIVMGKRAHQEELIAMNLPWWKKHYNRDEIEF
jgi:IQ calmodulin-binding motif-containing protein 1